MNNAEAVTNLVLPLFRNVPAARPGVCRICHTGPNNKGDDTPYEICSSCERTVNGLRRHVEPVVPISLAVTKGEDNQLFRTVARKTLVWSGTGWLRPEVLMAATLSRFYAAHKSCLTRLAGGPFTMVVTVPSTRLERPVEAADILPRVIGLIGALRGLYRPLLWANDEYAAVLAKRCSHPKAFKVMGAADGAKPLRGHRVLLVDDWFMSGAHVQSAAYALFEAGAEEVVGLVILRVIVPSPSHENRWSIWQEANAEPFSFDRCCLCAAARR
jgi:hypothetical protein